MLEWGGCQQFTYVAIRQKSLQHEKYSISVISSHDGGGSHFGGFFLRLSGTLNRFAQRLSLQITSKG